MDDTTNNLHAVLKQILYFDGRKADDFLEWSSKLRASLSIYNRAIFNILQGQERPSETNDSQATARAAGDAVNHDLFSILLFSTGGSAFFVVRRFEGTTLEDGAGHGQQAWAALREKFKGSSREVIRTEHSKVNNTRMRSDQDPDEYIYIMDSYRDRLNACDPPEGPTDRQYEDILLQALPPEYKAIRQAHLERGDFEFADVRCMMAATYADNLARSRSDSFRGIAGRGAAMRAMTRDRNDIKCRFCGLVGHFKIKCPLRFKQQQENDGQQPQQREGQQYHPRRQHQRNRGGGRGPVWCSYHRVTSHSDADCRTRRRKQADGNAHIAATRPSRIKGICSAFDLPEEEDDQPERPFISFTAT